MDRTSATENSPLLAKPTATLPDPGLTPDNVLSSEIGAYGHQSSHSKPVQDEESQSNGEGRGHQFEGLPDVKAKLWSIVPAIGIGVRFLDNCIDSLLTYARYSFQLPTRLLSYPATEKLVAI